MLKKILKFHKKKYATKITYIWDGKKKKIEKIEVFNPDGTLAYTVLGKDKKNIPKIIREKRLKN